MQNYNTGFPRYSRVTFEEKLRSACLNQSETVFFPLLFAGFPCFLVHEQSKPQIPGLRITRAACAHSYRVYQGLRYKVKMIWQYDFKLESIFAIAASKNTTCFKRGKTDPKTITVLLFPMSILKFIYIRCSGLRHD